MRILHLIKSLGRGGAEMLLPETLRLHDQDELEFHYGYFLPWKDQMVGRLEDLGSRVRCFSAMSTPAIFLRTLDIVKYIETHKIDLIHAHLPISGVVARLAGRMTCVPVIYTEHNLQERYHWATRWLNIRTLPMCSLVLGVSDEVTESVRKHSPVVEVRTLLNGVNTGRFDRDKFVGDEMRTQLGIGTNAPIIGTVAVFRDQKRLDEWVKLAEAISTESPDVHFFIVGDGPHEEALKKQVETAGLKGKVFFPGRLEEVRPWLAAMDIYLMTSKFEGLPIAMLEAMSMQLPIVATAAGGIGQVVRDGTEGFLKPVDEVGELIHPLWQLIQDKELRLNMGKAARDRVLAEFSMKRMVGELEGVYREVYAAHQKKKSG